MHPVCNKRTTSPPPLPTNRSKRALINCAKLEAELEANSANLWLIASNYRRVAY